MTVSFSDPTASNNRVRVIVPEFDVMVIVPSFAVSSKSAATVVPEFVQYSTVPSATSVVVTVNTTDAPSSTDETDGEIEYVEVIVGTAGCTIIFEMEDKKFGNPIEEIGDKYNLLKKLGFEIVIDDVCSDKNLCLRVKSDASGVGMPITNLKG
jgi:hypothetical protein